MLEDNRVIEFLETIQGHRFEYLYQLDLFTGMRQSELLGLQWPDIDFEHKTLQVKRQLLYLGGGGKGYQYATPKSNKPRLIVLPDLALQALLQQKKRQTEMRLMVGPAWENSDDLVFTDELGRHLKHDVVYRNLKRIFQRMGVSSISSSIMMRSVALENISVSPLRLPKKKKSFPSR